MRSGTAPTRQKEVFADVGLQVAAPEDAIAVEALTDNASFLRRPGQNLFEQAVGISTLPRPLSAGGVTGTTSAGAAPS